MGIEQRMHSNFYHGTTSNKNVFSERIPFYLIHPLSKFIHLKEDFTAGIRPCDDGAINVTSSQLGPGHLRKILTTK